MLINAGVIDFRRGRNRDYTIPIFPSKVNGSCRWESESSSVFSLLRTLIILSNVHCNSNRNPKPQAFPHFPLLHKIILEILTIACRSNSI